MKYRLEQLTTELGIAKDPQEIRLQIMKCILAEPKQFFMLNKGPNYDRFLTMALVVVGEFFDEPQMRERIKMLRDNLMEDMSETSLLADGLRPQRVITVTQFAQLMEREEIRFALQIVMVYINVKIYEHPQAQIWQLTLQTCDVIESAFDTQLRKEKLEL